MKPKEERDVTAEFVELMCALDALLDHTDPAVDLKPLDLEHAVRVGRVMLAHQEFRELVAKYDTVIHRNELPAAHPRH